jgi:uncharacterized protein
MTKALLIDTGPLIALVSKNDKYHRVCSETHRATGGPILTCWPVLTEATYMLRRLPDATARLFAAFTSKVFVLRPPTRRCRRVDRSVYAQICKY